MDIEVNDQGSIVILNAISVEGAKWCFKHIFHARRWGNCGYVVEHLYADNVINGMIDDGLSVE